MKKIIYLLLLLLIFTACSNSNSRSNISNGSDVLFSGPKNYSYTKQDLYNVLKLSSNDAVETHILKNIAKKYDIDMTNIEAQADELINMYTEQGQDIYIIQYYGSLDAYKQMYMDSLVVDSLNKVYVENNFDTIVEENKPVKMQIGIFTTEDDAKKCIEDVKAGTTFDTAAVNNNSTNTPATSIYTDSNASLNLSVKEYLNSTDTTGLSSIIPYTTVQSTSESSNETTEYYVLNIESRDVNDFRNEFIEVATLKLDNKEVRSYFFKNHDLKFFDQDIYEYMSKQYEVLK